jgi:hypothetical protein
LARRRSGWTSPVSRVVSHVLPCFVSKSVSRCAYRPGRSAARLLDADPLIRRSGQLVQDRPSPVVGWADIPELFRCVGCCSAPWLQSWLQSRRNGADPPALVVFKSMRGSLSITALTSTFSISARRAVQDHPANIPRVLRPVRAGTRGVSGRDSRSRTAT